MATCFCCCCCCCCCCIRGWVETKNGGRFEDKGPVLQLCRPAWGEVSCVCVFGAGCPSGVLRPDVDASENDEQDGEVE